MNRQELSSSFVVLAALTLAVAGARPADAAAPTRARALVLYDGTSQKMHEGRIDGLYVANLMGHFGYQAVLQPIED